MTLLVEALDGCFLEVGLANFIYFCFLFSKTALCSAVRLHRSPLRVVASLDYTSTASDDGVLRLPARTELDPDELKAIFGYPR